MRDIALKQAQPVAKKAALGKTRQHCRRGLLLALNDAVSIEPEWQCQGAERHGPRSVYTSLTMAWCDCPDRVRRQAHGVNMSASLHLHLIASMALKAHDSTCTPDPLMP